MEISLARAVAVFITQLKKKKKIKNESALVVKKIVLQSNAVRCVTYGRHEI